MSSLTEESTADQNRAVVKDSTLSVSTSDVNERLIAAKGPAFAEYRQRWEQSYRSAQPLAFPLHIDFETVYGCNLKCAMCHLHMRHPHARTFIELLQKMDFDLFKKVVDEGSENGLCAVTVNNLGEPLLRSDLFDFVRYAVSQGVLDVWMSTNGVLLNEEKADELIDSGVTRLNISLDAFTPETYRNVRGTDKLGKVQQNILHLMELRAKKGSITPIVKVSFCILRTNEHEVDDFVAFWTPRVDILSIQQYWDANPKENLKATRQVIEKFHCREPWHRIAVNVDGSVSPCCLPWREGFTMGNVATQTMSDIWNGEKMRRLRKCLQSEHFSAEFARCRECVEDRFKGSTED